MAQRVGRSKYVSGQQRTSVGEVAKAPVLGVLVLSKLLDTSVGKDLEVFLFGGNMFVVVLSFVCLKSMLCKITCCFVIIWGKCFF